MRRQLLPSPCALCRPSGGFWRVTESRGASRCSCPRGRALRDMGASGGHRNEQPSTSLVDWKSRAAGEREAA